MSRKAHVTDHADRCACADCHRVAHYHTGAKDLTIRADRRARREDIIARAETFRRTGHYPECFRNGEAHCDDTGCAAARFVSRWGEGRRV